MGSQSPPAILTAKAASAAAHWAAKRALLGLAPALEEQRQDGLLLRHARGFLPAANCAVPIEDGPAAATQKSTGERFFSETRMVPSFLLSDRAVEQPLNQLLDESGYLAGPVRQVMIAPPAIDTASVSDYSPAVRSNLSIAEFVSAYGTLSTLAGAAANSAAVKLQSLRLHALAQSARLHLLLAGKDLGCLLAAVITVDDQRIGVLADLFVAPAQRRRGLGRALMIAGIREIGRNGPISSILEMAEHNPKALKLYQSLGFQPAFRWWYRTQPFTSSKAQ